MAGNRETVASLLTEGRTPAEIALRLGLARNTVYYHVRRLRQERLRDGMGGDIAGAVPPAAKRSVETRAAVRRLLAEGHSRTQIAAQLGVSKPTVSAR